MDEEVALEQAVKFCQVHMGASAQKQVSSVKSAYLKHAFIKLPAKASVWLSICRNKKYLIFLYCCCLKIIGATLVEGAHPF